MQRASIHHMGDATVRRFLCYGLPEHVRAPPWRL